MTPEDAPVVGYCDGIKGEDIYGWAWRPDLPDQPVEIEVYLDGRLAQSTLASSYRPDLRAAGIGHGRYGWKLPFAPIPDDAHSVSVVVKCRDGAALVDGVFDHILDLSAVDQHNVEFQTFVANALGLAQLETSERIDPAPPANFLLYAPTSVASATMGLAEYSYAFVLEAFRPVLERLGNVFDVSNSLDHIDALHAEHLARGETSLLLSFAPPHRTPIDVRCPLIPVIAWEFPTVPTRMWDGNPRHDWRFVLRQAGRAIMLCDSAAGAVKSAMGPAFPVVAIPAPVWDRFPHLQTVSRPDGTAELVVDGFIFDSRGQTFAPAAASPPLPEEASVEGMRSTVVEGIIFTAVLSPKDGRKNWPDIVSAFLTAHRDTPDATLVLKMIGADPALWWWKLHDVIGRMPAFACRLVVVHGFMSDDRYNAMVVATHWVVNASRAEGLCLPLLEFMSAGRPAIAPVHTAMADYIDAHNAVIIASDEEFCGFPHDPRNEMTTTRHRISWSGLRDAFAEAYRLSTTEPSAYAARAQAARIRMRDFCSDEVVAARLDSFLGLNRGLGPPSAGPSALLSEVAAA